MKILMMMTIFKFRGFRGGDILNNFLVSYNDSGNSKLTGKFEFGEDGKKRKYKKFEFDNGIKTKELELKNGKTQYTVTK